MPKKKDKYVPEKGEIYPRKRTNVFQKKDKYIQEKDKSEIFQEDTPALSIYLPNGGGGHKKEGQI